ncbi:MAG: hypothetical protein L6Q71_02540 [Planctomycetes bacterium]|nr:hypothetical protein [Planctomycetota bacterium]NUQ34401.1 hypothetical protein [Planctomycetaceae bacterium]
MTAILTIDQEVWIEASAMLFAGTLLGVVLGGLIFAFGYAFKLDAESHDAGGGAAAGA